MVNARAPNYELAENDYMLGMKYKEIADKYQVSINTVKSWKKRYNWQKEGDSTSKKKVAHKNAHKSAKGCTQKNDVRIEQNETAAVEEAIEYEQAGMTEKQWLFCIYYVRYRNKVKAYQKAYQCSYENACAHATTLWKNVEIQKMIQKLLAEYRDNLNLDIKDIFQMYIDIAIDEEGVSPKDRMRAMDWLSSHISDTEEQEKKEKLTNIADILSQMNDIKDGDIDE